MMRFIRLVGGGLGVILAISLAGFGGTSSGLLEPTIEGRLLLATWIAAWFVVGYAILPYLTVEPAKRLANAVRTMSTGEFISAVLGLLVGLLMGLLLGLPLANFPEPYGWLLPLGVSLVLGPGHDGPHRRQARRSVPGAAGGRSGRSGRCRTRPSMAQTEQRLVSYLDTSAIIDGRLVDVVASGFLWGTLVVPRFVLGELQHIADDAKPDRRSRGRRGLEVLSVLQKDHRIDLELTDEDAPEIKAVDAKLVALARARGAAVLTTDYNLNRVAQLQGVRVMNLNQLANAMKPAFLPGEEMRVKVIQQGKEPGQGVAFLDDGTMIVVEGGGSHLQNEIDVVVTRVLQTVAGRMVFAQISAV